MADHKRSQNHRCARPIAVRHTLESRQEYRAAGRPDTDLGFMRKYLTRKQLTGRSPRSLVVSGGRAYAGMFFTGSVESVSVDDISAIPNVIPIGSQPVESEVRQGERLFNDASIAFQGWLSCSTCHPDGRADGLNWDLSNDGIGNPKNAKSLLLSHETPPVMWTGLFETLADCVPFEIRTILFSGRPPQDSAAIVAYLRSLKPTPSPFLANGELTESARRGEAAVQKAGCNECHRGEFLTSMERRSVGVYSDGDPREFDVPTWREVWRTAPYLHDGRATSVKEIFTRFDPENRHGRHQTLSPQELDDLVQFVLSQ
jgi:cytochrome c peroxidase